MARPLGSSEQRTETWKERLDKRQLRKDNTRDIQIDPGDRTRDANEVRNLDGGPDQIGFAQGGKVEGTRTMKKPATKMAKAKGARPAKMAMPTAKAMPPAKMSNRDVNMTSKGVPRLAAASGKAKGFVM